jgi:hypothetical protein
VFAQKYPTVVDDVCLSDKVDFFVDVRHGLSI